MERRNSSGAQNEVLLRKQCDLVALYLENAKSCLHKGDLDNASDNCQQALKYLPDYVPAIVLEKKIKKASKSKNESTLSDISTTSDSSSANEDNRAFGRQNFNKIGDKSKVKQKSGTFEKLDYGAPRVEKQGVRFQDDSNVPATPHPVKGILKYPSMGDLTGQGESTYQQQKPLKWRTTKKILLEGHFGDLSPIELFLQLKELWDSRSKVYVCPYDACPNVYKHRLLCVNHILCRHFSTHKDVEVLPFHCRTCKTGHRTMDDLVAHGQTSHPKCHWLPQLLRVLNK